MSGFAPISTVAPSPLQPACERGDGVLVRLLPLRLWVARQDADAVVPQPLLARLRKLEPPPSRLGAVGHRPGDRGRARDPPPTGARGPTDRDVGGRMVSRQRLAAARDDLPGRLVAEDAAVVRRIADRGADVRPGVEPRQPRGQRRRRSTGGAAWRAGSDPTGCCRCRGSN